MLPDVAEILLDFGGPLPKKGMFSEQLVEAEKRAERGPDLVADVREELALGSAGLLGGIPGLAHRLGLLERLLDAFLFGDVPADAQEPLLGVFDNPGDQQELADLGISGPGKDPQLEAGQGFAAHRLLMKTQSGFKVVGVNQRVEPAADPIGARPARDRLERRAQGDHDSLAVEFPEDDTGGLDQAVVPSLRLLEGLEGPLAVADVAGHDQSDRLGLGVNPAHTDVDRQGRACCPAKIIPLARVKEPRSIQCQGEPVEIAGSAAEEEVAQAHRAG